MIIFKKMNQFCFRLKSQALHFFLTSTVRFVNFIKYKNLRNLPVDEQIYEVEKLIQKTKIYMEKKNEELEIISKNWKDHVFNKHNVQKKSKYILQIITNYLNLNKNKL